jgi:hypothetical protein
MFVAELLQMKVIVMQLLHGVQQIALMITEFKEVATVV